MKALRVGITLAVAVALAGAASPAAAMEEPSEPNVMVLFSAGFTGVGGQGWTEGDVADLYYNGDYLATSGPAEPNAEGTASVIFSADDLGITIVPGDEIELRMGGYSTGVHVVTSLAVTLVSATQDTVAGTAEPGSEVVVVIRPDDNVPLVTVDRYVTADADGNWLADFSKRGDRLDEQTTFDIGADSYGFAMQVDEDENATAFIWVPTVISKTECKDDGWQGFGIFENQGECMRHAADRSS